MPTWSAWKNVDAALAGVGDVDSVAPVADWPAVTRRFLLWSSENGLGPVVMCTHLPGVLILVACEPRSSRRLLELEVAARLMFRGAELATAEELRVLAELDPRGFRRLRPGAEGLLLFLMRRTPRTREGHDSPNDRAVRLMREDAEGVLATSQVVGWPGKIGRHGAAAALGNRAYLPWFAAWHAALAARALRHPSLVAGRIAFGFTWRRRCPVIAALDAGRRIPANRERWLAEVARTHSVDGET